MSRLLTQSRHHDAGPRGSATELLLPAFARFAPPPAAHLVAAQIEALTHPGDVVVDLCGRGGWVARSALAALRRAYTFESSPLTRLLADLVLRPPDLRHFDAAVSTVGTKPRGEVSLRQWLDALFASRCPACGRWVVVDEFIWDGDAEAPFRKSYRCAGCDQRTGGRGQRSASTDELDAQRAARTEWDGQARAALLARFPRTVMADEANTGLPPLPDQLLGLFTPRSLVAVEAILQRIDSDLRARSIEAALRLAFIHMLLPASKLSSYPSRVAALRIDHGRVRLPRKRQWREHNPWHLFEEGCRHVRALIQALTATSSNLAHARFGEGLRALLDGSANVVIRTGDPGVVDPTSGVHRSGRVDDSDARNGRHRVRLVLTQPPPRWTRENLSFAYLATALALGPDAASTLPLAALYAGRPPGDWSSNARMLRERLDAVRPALASNARLIVLLGPAEPEALFAVALGGVAAGFRVTRAIPSGSGSEDGGIVEFEVDEQPRGTASHPDVDGIRDAVTEVAVDVLQARGEPARADRLLGEVLVGLAARGLLAGLLATPTGAASEALGAAPDGDSENGESSGLETTQSATDEVGRLFRLVLAELRRADHPRLTPIDDGRSWLRDALDIERAALPLSDRLEWAVFGLLSASAGGASERRLFDRVGAMFRGRDSPDEELVRACIESYRARGSTPESLRTDDELQRRYDDHTELVALLVEYGHRLGLHCWIGRREQKRRYRGVPLRELLTEAERRVDLSSVVPAPVDALEDIDCIWYLPRAGKAFLFEVEWTAMLAEPLLRRASRIPRDAAAVRFLVILPERAELVRFKLARSPLLQRAIDEGNWHILKADHLRTLVTEDGADLERLRPYLGLDPEIERQGEQLALFGDQRSTPD